MKKIKVGCHNFLNSKPFILPLIRGDLKHHFEIILDTPVKISELLRKGKLDVGFIPSIEYLKNKNLKLIPDICIASDGEVKSVILLSKKEIKKIKTVALDKRSKTSVALLKILFKKFYKVNVKYLEDTKANQQKADSKLIIGDEALFFTYPARVPAASQELPCYIFDLGKEWKKFTKLPFVFAVIAAKPTVNLDYVRETLLKAKSIGIRDIADIAMKTADQAGLSYNQCYNYLSDKIKYGLGRKELKGLSRFQDLVFEIGELKGKREIRA
ncbi:MAG: hypothetical protein A2149_06380 [Candidatus Schekmanbacteria bacterium RBG_16_38_11]|uniref:Chorismate dehydratase n=1 Tax=Candidatus Schekmanbacteria bacterium RBG_16_38_11 TaxID=1817880 RepID=A0A1F7RV53_9BACT|nr:MAG: hypothetical protein A2149_06380 [Candidatus Schekmanbacteria bacterium RBG_16_38_11]